MQDELAEGRSGKWNEQFKGLEIECGEKKRDRNMWPEIWIMKTAGPRIVRTLISKDGPRESVEWVPREETRNRVAGTDLFLSFSLENFLSFDETKNQHF